MRLGSWAFVPGNGVLKAMLRLVLVLCHAHFVPK
jgi:hypothetical protein